MRSRAWLVALGMLACCAASAADNPVDAALEAVASDADAWETCVVGFVARVAARNPEPAEVIAKAAFSICLRYEHIVFETMANSSRYPWWREFVATQLFPAIRESAQEKTIAAVLAARSR